MTQIVHFRRVLYTLLALGITGFTLAAASPGLWVLAMAGLMLNAWLIRHKRFEPLPRILALAAALVALAHTAVEIRGGATPILAIGTFLVLLHLVKLYEQRANRDYAQMLVLSLLLMAAAAISTASLVFAAILVAYLLLSLYCSLLFHLKVESDAAAETLGQRAPRGAAALLAVNPALQAGDQRRLGASMRLLTAMISVVSLAVAVAVFLFFPRGSAEGFFGRRSWMMPEAAVGFNEQVSLDQVARINQSDEVVGQVKVSYNGKPWGGAEPLLLRGATLDEYTGAGDKDVMPWEWRRGKTEDAVPDQTFLPGMMNIVHGQQDLDVAYEQDVMLEPTDSHALLGMAGIRALDPSLQLRLRYWPRDGILLSVNEPLANSQHLHYVVRSSGEAPVDEELSSQTPKNRIDARIASYARRPDVSGTDEQGRSFAALRGTADAPADIDRRIALSIAQHLRSQLFKYTTDLTKLPTRYEDEDPLVTFLYTWHEGHCEYFAGAMALMCQSLGMQARMVVGYRCDVMNSVGQFYVVNQNQAHAWVEVLITQDDGHKRWETYDPTSSNMAMTTASNGVLGQIRSLFNYLEYRWGTSVVAYGQDNRKNLITAIDSTVKSAQDVSTQSMNRLPTWLDDLSGVLANPTRIEALVMLMSGIIIAAIGYYLCERWRLRRRVSRIGLNGLPAHDQRRLARQLGFYDEMLQRLARRGLAPGANLTPQEFSDRLSDLPPQTYHDIRRLTRLYYRIRYGNAVLSDTQRRRVDSVMARFTF